MTDTNVFIYLLDKHPSLQQLLKSEWLFSFITEIELLGKQGISEAEIKEVSSLLSSCIKIPHSDKITSAAINLKQHYKLKVPDAIIAATAIEQRLPLLTFDQDFTKIKPLDIVLLE